VNAENGFWHYLRMLKRFLGCLSTIFERFGHYLGMLKFQNNGPIATFRSKSRKFHPVTPPLPLREAVHSIIYKVELLIRIMEG
jgi:hypothetical protein